MKQREDLVYARPDYSIRLYKKERKSHDKVSAKGLRQKRQSTQKFYGNLVLRSEEYTTAGIPAPMEKQLQNLTPLSFNLATIYSMPCC